MTVVMDKGALTDFMARDFAQVADVLSVEGVSEAGVTLRFTPNDAHLRPGGTVSGPSIFMLADVAAYVAILSRIGEVPLAVTTNASLDFMRKPAAGVPLLGEAQVMKLGRVLAVTRVEVRNPDDPRVLAQAQFTYSIPPTRD